ncbi:MAG: cysteine hydrolase [Clostridia bacterium]|nr:cysteine hydrolase [Clostridia bacterium]
MKNYLIVVDMQTDFINGALGTKEAEAILPRVRERIERFEGEVIFTRDTHEESYLTTQEGRVLPVEHCVKDRSGWQIDPLLAPFVEKVIDKPTFGSVALGEYLREENDRETIGSITLVGLCTDICVISNALLIKAFLPEVAITVDASCCAGVTPESHQTALNAMKMCQITVENE